MFQFAILLFFFSIIFFHISRQVRFLDHEVANFFAYTIVSFAHEYDSEQLFHSNVDGDLEGSFRHHFVTIDHTFSNITVSSAIYHVVECEGNSENTDAIIFGHGLGESWRTWISVVEPLCETSRIIVFDMESMGQSTWDSMKDDLANYWSDPMDFIADMQRQLLHQLGVIRVTLVGIDYSAESMLRLAGLLTQDGHLSPCNEGMKAAANQKDGTEGINIVSSSGFYHPTTRIARTDSFSETSRTSSAEGDVIRETNSRECQAAIFQLQMRGLILMQTTIGVEYYSPRQLVPVELVRRFPTAVGFALDANPYAAVRVLFGRPLRPWPKLRKFQRIAAAAEIVNPFSESSTADAFTANLQAEGTIESSQPHSSGTRRVPSAAPSQDAYPPIIISSSNGSLASQHNHHHYPTDDPEVFSDEVFFAKVMTGVPHSGMYAPWVAWQSSEKGPSASSCTAWASRIAAYRDVRVPVLVLQGTHPTGRLPGFLFDGSAMTLLRPILLEGPTGAASRGEYGEILWRHSCNSTHELVTVKLSAMVEQQQWQQPQQGGKQQLQQGPGLSPSAGARSFFPRSPSVEVHLMEHVGGFPHLEDPTAVRKAIADFVQAHLLKTASLNSISSSNVQHNQQ